LPVLTWLKDTSFALFHIKRQPSVGRRDRKEGVMALLKWSLLFALAAIIAAIFGFTDIAAGSAEIARVLFFLFLAIVVVFVVLGMVVFRSVTP
jgi:uncharacterized membrane protein YtjA (UPF0391 family)